MTIAIVKEVFSTLKCCEALSIEDELIPAIKDRIPRLYPYKIGSRDSSWNGKRSRGRSHTTGISPYLSLHPGTEITQLDTPELAEACRRSRIFAG